IPGYPHARNFFHSIHINADSKVNCLMSRVAQKCTKNGREKCTTLASWSIHIDNFLFDFFFSHGDPSGKPKTFPPNIQNNTVMEQPAG
ncbi:MAG TPA: hypothetical protein DHW42_08915, partial [Candidatus Marinimicrobia bacterium]|nr:hypothetical protein [Candidatus Neomarinimicrobiota bacterium]